MEILVYYENSNNDTELAMLLDSAMEDTLDGSYDFYDLGLVDPGSITVENIGMYIGDCNVNCSYETRKQVAGHKSYFTSTVVVTYRPSALNQAEQINNCYAT